MSKKTYQQMTDGEKANALESILERRKAAEQAKEAEAETDAPKQPEPATTFNLRARLKGIVEGEIDQLPETLKDMAPEDRAAFILKLMPHVMPKVKSLSPTYDAPKSSWDWSPV